MALQHGRPIGIYRPEVDGLRAVAVLPVLFYHAGFDAFSGGFVGVDVFFVISGYLITQIILQGIKDGSFSVKRFYERRFRRILPALFLVLLVTVPAALIWLQPSALDDYFEALIAIVFFASNVLFWQQSDYFAENAEENPVLHTWSLSVEEQFYVAFPILLVILWKMGWQRTFIFLGLGMAVSFGMTEWGWRNSSVANFFLLPTRAWELLMGATISVWASAHVEPFSGNFRWSSVASWTGLACIFIAIFAFDESTPFPSYFALLPTVGTALILMYASPSNRMGRLLAYRPLVATGLISYSLYLWHQPVFAFARLRSLEALTVLDYLMLTVLSFGLAYCSWRFVEMPFRDRSRTSTRTLAWSLLGAGSLLLLVGVSGKVGFIGPSDERIEASEIADIAWRQRHKAVKSGVCHFNTLGPSHVISEFLQRWDCWGDPSIDSHRMLVVGDSHAADKALSLWQNDMPVGLMSGADCSLDPTRMTADCQRLFDLVVEQSAANDVRWILLANRFVNAELTNESLDRVVRYWSKSGARLVLFSGMPVYERFRSILGRAAYRQLDFGSLMISRDERIALRSELLFQQFAEREDKVAMLNTRAIFCSLSEGCGWRQRETTLLADHDHLSVAGAKLFGGALKRRLGTLLSASRIPE